MGENVEKSSYKVSPLFGELIQMQGAFSSFSFSVVALFKTEFWNN